MKYDLNSIANQTKPATGFGTIKKLLRLISHEKNNLLKALLTIMANSFLNLLTPFIIGIAVDRYIRVKNFQGVLHFGALLLMIYLTILFTSYLQTKLMGGIGQRLLFTLRNSLFNKLQQLPVLFFNENKAGDLISRLNNDTDKINQFFSQALIQFISSIVSMTGVVIFLLFINWKLGIATLLPAMLVFLFTRMISPWVKRKNAVNMKNTGGLSAEIQESLNNFKVIIAFNRRDFFRKKFEVANSSNYRSALAAGYANNIFLPVYSLIASVAQLVVLAYGIYLISHGQFTIGLLVSFLAYANNFYFPLRQLATLWSSFQLAMVAWDRVSQILEMKSEVPTIINTHECDPHTFLSFKDVSFAYTEGKEILHHINFNIQSGKTYAFVGPTGGGKTTTASLMARLYDSTAGVVCLNGKDIRTYDAAVRCQKIGFILQEPILFSATIRENIIYGNEAYYGFDNAQLQKVIEENNLTPLLKIFDQGLDTMVIPGRDNLSLGQKQLIAFIRAVLRKPDLLILDEATANIDTITEKLLEDILDQLPPTSTKVIIAHRLNTIKNADEIFFVNAGNVIPAGSFENALELLLHNKGTS